MTAHEELENIRQRIEGLERRSAIILGVAGERASQLEQIGRDVLQIGREVLEITRQIHELRAGMLALMQRAMEAN